MNINIQPLYDRVVIKRLPKKNQSKGGIIIPDNNSEKPSIGVIMFVGNGKTNSDGSVQHPIVRVGQKVVFGKWSGTALDSDILEHLNVDNKDENDGELIVLKEEDIMLIIN